MVFNDLPRCGYVDLMLLQYDEKSGAVVHAILANGWAVGQAPGVEVSRALSVAQVCPLILLCLPFIFNVYAVQITSSDHVSRVGLKIEAVHRILLALSADPIPFASLVSPLFLGLCKHCSCAIEACSLMNIVAVVIFQPC